MAGSIVINEFLTFVQNKSDDLDEPSIILICSNNYTDSEIEAGKTALYEVCGGNGVRNIQRKGDDKRKKNIKDVLKLVKETPRDEQPIFVARDLSRLPSVTFDYVDVTCLLKDMSTMKNEFTQLQNRVATEMSDLRASLSSNTTPATPKRRLSKQTEKPLAPVPVPSGTHTEVAAESSLSVHTPTYRDIVFKERSQRAKTTQHRGTTQPVESTRKLLENANTVTTPSETDDDKTPFIEVVRKQRKRNINMRGSLTNSCKIQVVESQCAIYLSRASKNVTVVDIREHIKEMGEQCIEVELLKQNRETLFNSFKVKILCSKLSTFLDTKFWPEGLVYRRFRENTARSSASNTQ